MKLRYIGQSFLVGLTNGKIYECLGIEYGWFRVIDDTKVDYLYLPDDPGANSGVQGKWEVVEDTKDGLLQLTIDGKSEKVPRIIRFHKLRLQYIGESFGKDCGLTNGVIYECAGVEENDTVYIIDDSGEGHYYSAIDPGPRDKSVPTGKWKVIKDLECGLLKGLANGEGLPPLD